MPTVCSEDTRLLLSPTALLAPVGEETCVLDTKSGSYFMLNRVGSFIWEQFRAGHTCGEVHRALVAEFSVAGDVLWNDLLLFIDSLNRQKLVSIQSAAAGNQEA